MLNNVLALNNSNIVLILLVCVAPKIIIAIQYPATHIFFAYSLGKLKQHFLSWGIKTSITLAQIPFQVTTSDIEIISTSSKISHAHILKIFIN